jgi:cell division protein ZapA
MGQVTVTLNGRSYRLRCGDGDEARLRSLAADVQSRIEALASEFGQVGDERLLVMAALLIADELWDARAQLGERARASVESHRAVASSHSSDVGADTVAAENETTPHHLPRDEGAEGEIDEQAEVKGRTDRSVRRGTGSSSLSDRLSEVTVENAAAGRRARN